MMKQEPTSHQRVQKVNNSEQKFNQFYRLHYPQPKSGSKEDSSFRNKSVISVTERTNPEETPRQLKSKRRSSHFTKPVSIDLKPKSEQPVLEIFSLKKALSAKKENESVKEYFQKYPPLYFGNLQELSKRSIGIKNAMQRCKDEKLKVGRVLGSQQQSQITKLDYVHLKKQQLQKDKNEQIRQIYDQFFRKQYEQLHGEKGYSEFKGKIEETVTILHHQLFGH